MSVSGAAMTLATELASLALLDRSADDTRLLAYFCLHGIAAALGAATVWAMLPRRLKTSWQGAALIFSIGFFIPGLGLLAILMVIYLAWQFPKGINTDRYVEIVLPQYLSTEKDKVVLGDLRAGHARRVLASASELVDTKLRVLIALQNMRPKVAIPMLQGLLGDPAEDVRLLAYSMMDAWEKDITQRVQAAQAQLDALEKSTASDAGEQGIQRFNAHRRLAELFWEQVDTKLARGDLRVFALKQSKQHCEYALALDPNAAGVWLLFGVVLVELGMDDVAQRALRIARGGGADAAAVHKQLARLAFERGDYSAVKRYMQAVESSERVTHDLRQVSRFWTGKRVDLSL